MHHAHPAPAKGMILVLLAAAALTAPGTATAHGDDEHTNGHTGCTPACIILEDCSTDCAEELRVDGDSIPGWTGSRDGAAPASDDEDEESTCIPFDCVHADSPSCSLVRQTGVCYQLHVQVHVDDVLATTITGRILA